MEHNAEHTTGEKCALTEKTKKKTSVYIAYCDLDVYVTELYVFERNLWLQQQQR